jgi:Fe-S oxidoreductase
MDLKVKVPIISELAAENLKCEYLFWVGSVGSYDERIKEITRSFAKILIHCDIDFAILGVEESDSGDVARRAGNEFLFQMQAMHNIETFKMYDIRKVITCCPHDYNTFKNEYTDFGYSFQTFHHSQFIMMLINSGKLKINNNPLNGKRITYHDPCYLGRGNKIYDEPRMILKNISSNFVEIKRNKARSLCCGAGGAQIFKDADKGLMEVSQMRTNEILETNPEIIATSCPFCMIMLSEGMNQYGNNELTKVYDLAELVVMAINI